MVTIFQSRALIAGNQALLRATRHRVAASRRTLNPAFGLSGGRVSPEEEALRDAIRERVLAGALFWASGHSHIRRGTGRECAVCGRVIGSDAIERQVTGPRSTKSAIAHEDCWILWRDVCRGLEPSSA